MEPQTNIKRENAAMARASIGIRDYKRKYMLPLNLVILMSLSLPRVEVLSDDECVDTEEVIPTENYKEWISCQS